MREQEFREWLAAGPRSPGTVSTQVSKVRKLEKHFGDLDEMIADGRIEDLAQTLSDPEMAPAELGAVAERRHLRQSLRYYRQFAEAGGGKAVFDESALSELKQRFLNAFPDFESEGGFAGNSGFHAQEDDYKRALIARAAELVDAHRQDPVRLGGDLLDLIANETGLESNLLGWRMAQGLRQRREEHPGLLERAAARIALAQDPGDAVLAFIDDTWETAFADSRNNPYSDSRMIPTLLAALVHPTETIALRTDRFNHLSQRLFSHRLFGWNPLNADELERATDTAMRLMQIMRDDWAWRPRDLWDVQGFIWVALSPEAGKSDEGPYWFVGAAFGGHDHQLDRFLEERIWEISEPGEPHRLQVLSMQPGQKIAIKSTYVRKKDLPFDNRDQPVSVMAIKATGTIKSNPGTGEAVEVDWDPSFELREWYHFTYQQTIWELYPDREEARQLIAFAFEGAEQDLAWFHAQPYWRDRFGPQASEKDEFLMPPTNLVLYGPPGTGKTYRTVKEAVLLCDGEAEYGEDEAGRAALMARYDALVKARQIEFVTFHQNFSYEDFVEGLRPHTGTKSTGGFSLFPEAGIFRAICRRAEGIADVEDTTKSLAGRKFYKMSLGEAGNASYDWVFDESIAGGYALFSFGCIDWSDERYSEIGEILKEAQLRRPTENITLQSGIVQCTDMFRNEVVEGDVLIVSKGRSQFRAIGIVEGEYEYAPRDDEHYCHRRKVKWLWSTSDALPVEEIQPINFGIKTIHPLGTRDGLNLERLEELIAGGVAVNDEIGDEKETLPHVLIIDEINRANISKVFGELITLIEPDKRLGMANALKVRLPYSKREFGVPANLHIIGTMNTADRSIALLDTALRRRFRFEEIAPEPRLLAEQVDGVPLRRVLEIMNERIEYLHDREHRIGHAFFMGDGGTDRKAIDATMRDKVIPLLQEYFFDDWSRIAAVVGQGFIEKRKLSVPPGIEAGEDRLSWSVRSEFAGDAYDTLIGKAHLGDVPVVQSAQ